MITKCYVTYLINVKKRGCGRRHATAVAVSESKLIILGFRTPNPAVFSGIKYGLTSVE